MWNVYYVEALVLIKFVNLNRFCIFVVFYLLLTILFVVYNLLACNLHFLLDSLNFILDIQFDLEFHLMFQFVSCL